MVVFFLVGMRIGFIINSKKSVMKKTLGKFLNAFWKKIRDKKNEIKKINFSNYKEDFVITEQKEKEGGFFGQLNFTIASAPK